MFRKPPVPSVSEGTTSGAREHRGSNLARRAQQRKTALTWPEIVRRRAMPPSNSAIIHLNLPKPDFLASTLANRPHSLRVWKTLDGSPRHIRTGPVSTWTKVGYTPTPPPLNFKASFAKTGLGIPATVKSTA